MRPEDNSLRISNNRFKKPVIVSTRSLRVSWFLHEPDSGRLSIEVSVNSGSIELELFSELH